MGYIFRSFSNPSSELTDDSSIIDLWLPLLYNQATPDLQYALNQLNGVKDEAQEEGFEIPNELAIKNARQLLLEMYKIYPICYEIFPAQMGEVSIHAQVGFRKSVVVICDSDGSILCLVSILDSSRRARYSTSAGLPDGFIMEALLELKNTKEQAD